MKVFIAGGGPAGLYAGYRIKRLRPDAEITIVEQNAAGATFGFGVVFSTQALAFLGKDDPETLGLIEPALKSWTDLTIVHEGETIGIDGVGFAAIGRLTLLGLLQKRLASEGVSVRYGEALSAPPDLAAFDLVIAADGANSVVRSQYADAFGTKVAPLTNRFAWFGTIQPFDTLTQTFVRTEAGHFNAHHYTYEPGMSTFIVECDPATWAASGLSKMTEGESVALCQSIFSDALGGHGLVANKSTWRQFPRISNGVWHHRNVVLVGDALRTAHFSIGSGTRLALEDVIALTDALVAADFDVAVALPAYERERKPVVEKLVSAANASAAWYERFPEYMTLKPWPFAWSYIQRSGRVDIEKLKRTAPKFVDRLMANKGMTERQTP